MFVGNFKKVIKGLSMPYAHGMALAGKKTPKGALISNLSGTLNSFKQNFSTKSKPTVQSKSKAPIIKRLFNLEKLSGKVNSVEQNFVAKPEPSAQSEEKNWSLEGVNPCEKVEKVMDMWLSEEDSARNKCRHQRVLQKQLNYEISLISTVGRRNRREAEALACPHNMSLSEESITTQESVDLAQAKTTLKHSLQQKGLSMLGVGKMACQKSLVGLNTCTARVGTFFSESEVAVPWSGKTADSSSYRSGSLEQKIAENLLLFLPGFYAAVNRSANKATINHKTVVSSPHLPSPPKTPDLGKLSRGEDIKRDWEDDEVVADTIQDWINAGRPHTYLNIIYLFIHSLIKKF